MGATTARPRLERRTLHRSLGSWGNRTVAHGPSIRLRTRRVAETAPTSRQCETSVQILGRRRRDRTFERRARDRAAVLVKRCGVEMAILERGRDDRASRAHASAAARVCPFPLRTRVSVRGRARRPTPLAPSPARRARRGVSLVAPVGAGGLVILVPPAATQRHLWRLCRLNTTPPQATTAVAALWRPPPGHTRKVSTPRRTANPAKVAQAARGSGASLEQTATRGRSLCTGVYSN